MNKEETTKVLAILTAMYPNYYKNMTKDEAAAVVNVWFYQFRDVPADVVIMALQKSISTSPFPPSIAEIRGKFRKLQIEAEIGFNNSTDPEERAKYEYIANVLRPFFNKKDYEIELKNMLDLVNTKSLTGGRDNERYIEE